ncbi:hypothetical protein SLA2020_212450 [Shorea laevis]
MIGGRTERKGEKVGRRGAEMEICANGFRAREGEEWRRCHVARCGSWNLGSGPTDNIRRDGDVTRWRSERMGE